MEGTHLVTKQEMDTECAIHVSAREKQVKRARDAFEATKSAMNMQMQRYLERMQHAKSQVETSKRGVLQGRISQDATLQAKIMRTKAERDLLLRQLESHDVFRLVLRAVVYGRNELTSADRAFVRLL